MSAASTEFDLRMFSSHDSGMSLQCAAPVLCEIRAEVLAGFACIQHGGVEIGGVLFGNRGSGGVRILARRPVACEYAYGPSFTLSKKDEAGLEALLAHAARDAELAGMQPVGWYHSHTRRELCLTERDLELHQRCFPEIWQIALVLKPSKENSVRAAIFVRQSDGSMSPDAAGEFTLPQGFAPGPEPDLPLPGEQAPEALPPPAPEPPQAAAPLPAPPAIVEGRRAVLRRHAPTALLVLLAVAAVAWLWPSPGSSGGVGLRALEQSGQLQILWDRGSPRIAGSSQGTLEIADGSAIWRTALNSEQLRKGYLVYARQSAAVVVRLRLQQAGGKPFEETTHFIGPPVETSAAPAPDGDADRLKAPEIEPVRAAVARQSAELDRLESILSGMAKDVKPRAATREARTIAAPEAPPPRARARSEAALAPPPPVVAASQPNLSVVEKLGAAGPQAKPPAAAAPAPKPPAAAVPEPKPPAAAVPSSGKLIWAGRLVRRAVLTIEGGRASTGSLIGALPGVPVRITVFPADLTREGLVLFAPTARYNGRTEPPGSTNGWNRTSFVWNPKQAADIAVLEPPHAENNWNRITLRSETRPYSVVVVEWVTLP
jgi:proteasome lid subunit RPN8/RPN11